MITVKNLKKPLQKLKSGAKKLKKFQKIREKSVVKKPFKFLKTPLKIR